MNEIHKRIETALESIRPYLQSDGGDVKFLRLRDDLTVEVKLFGSCESCSMSNMTMKAGIEEAIRKVFPEIKKVEAVQN